MVKRNVCGCLLVLGLGFVSGCGGGEKPTVIETTEEQRAAAVADAEDYEKQMNAEFENEKETGN